MEAVVSVIRMDVIVREALLDVIRVMTVPKDVQMGSPVDPHPVPVVLRVRREI